MMIPTRTLSFTAALLVSGSLLAQAAPQRDNRDLRDSVRRVERETGGSVLRAERIHGREMNRVKVLTPEGRVRVVHEDQERSARPPRGPEPRPAPLEVDDPRR